MRNKPQRLFQHGMFGIEDEYFLHKKPLRVSDFGTLSGIFNELLQIIQIFDATFTTNLNHTTILC